MNAISPTHTILAAEDDPDDRALMREALELCVSCCNLKFAENGADLLDYLHQTLPEPDSPAAGLPRLILLDLNMPRMSGLEALRAIKADTRFRSIPVVIWTTSDSVRDKEASFKEGAERFLTKPSSFGEMERMLCEVACTWLPVEV